MTDTSSVAVEWAPDTDGGASADIGSVDHDRVTSWWTASTHTTPSAPTDAPSAPLLPAERVLAAAAERSATVRSFLAATLGGAADGDGADAEFGDDGSSAAPEADAHLVPGGDAHATVEAAARGGEFAAALAVVQAGLTHARDSGTDARPAVEPALVSTGAAGISGAPGAAQRDAQLAIVHEGDGEEDDEDGDEGADGSGRNLRPTGGAASLGSTDAGGPAGHSAAIPPAPAAPPSDSKLTGAEAEADGWLDASVVLGGARAAENADCAGAPPAPRCGGADGAPAAAADVAFAPPAVALAPDAGTQLGASASGRSHARDAAGVGDGVVDAPVLPVQTQAAPAGSPPVPAPTAQLQPPAAAAGATSPSFDAWATARAMAAEAAAATPSAPAPPPGGTGGCLGWLGARGWLGASRARAAAGTARGRDAVAALARTPFDARSGAHGRAMDALHAALTGAPPVRGRADWTAIGFQREEGFETDLRGVGMLGPLGVLLLHAQAGGAPLVRSAFAASRRGGGYPFMAQALALTAHAVRALRSGALDVLVAERRAAAAAARARAGGGGGGSSSGGDVADADFTSAALGVLVAYLAALWLAFGRAWDAEGAPGVMAVSRLTAEAARSVAMRPRRAVAAAAAALAS